MIGLLVFLLILAAAVGVWRVASRRAVHVHDSQGRRLFADSAEGLRVIGGVVGALVLLLILATSFRVIPVGHALVIFNTVSKSSGSGDRASPWSRHSSA